MRIETARHTDTMRRGDESNVLCRYFFQAMVGDEDAVPDEHSSSMMLSSQPTLSELQRKFPFEGTYHFRLQVATKDGSYCWLDLTDPAQTLPVSRSGDIHIKVLQVSPESKTSKDTDYSPDQVDVPEDRLFDAYFRSQEGSKSGRGADDSSGFSSSQDVGAVLSGVKKALASKMKQSGLGQSLQKKLDKVLGSSSGDAPPTAVALSQLAKLVGAMKSPLNEGNREHMELLNRLWVCCFESQPFVVAGPQWAQLGFRSQEPLRELQYVLPLQCLVFFHEVHRQIALPILNDQAAPGNPDSYSYGHVASKISYRLADMLQLKDGACLGLERPFWRLFEDPIAFFELFSIMFRAFDQSFKTSRSKSLDVGVHLDYAGDFAQELLRRGPESVAALVDCAHQLQKW